MCWQYRHYDCDPDDMRAEAMCGMLQGIRRWRPDGGASIRTYSLIWARSYVLKYVLGDWSLVRRHQMRSVEFWALRAEERQAWREQRHFDSGIHKDLPLDAPLGDKPNSETWLDMLPGDLADGGDAADILALREVLLEGMLKLTHREALILHHVSVSGDFYLAEIGAAYGFSRERARQIHASAVKKMRDFIEQKYPEYAIASKKVA